MGLTRIATKMTIDGIIAIKNIDSLIKAYQFGIEKATKLNRLDLISSNKFSIHNLQNVKQLLVGLECEIEYKRWLQS